MNKHSLRQKVFRHFGFQCLEISTLYSLKMGSVNQNLVSLNFPIKLYKKQFIFFIPKYPFSIKPYSPLLFVMVPVDVITPTSTPYINKSAALPTPAELRPAERTHRKNFVSHFFFKIIFFLNLN